MTLAFSDSQIQTMSKDALLLPMMINDPATGYIAQKNMLLASVGSLLTTDTNMKIFSDFYELVQQKYHAELVLLNNSQRTNYSDADLVSGGQGVGPHFPGASWLKLPPKLVPSVNGLPVTTLTNNLEEYHSTKLNDAIDLLKNGFNHGAFSSSVTITGNSFSSEFAMTGLAVGHKVILSNGTQVFFVVIDTVGSTTTPNPTPPPPDIITYGATFTVIAGTAFSGIANAANSFAGFTDAQRNGSVAATPAYIYNFLTGQVDTWVASWKAYINSIKAVVDANPDLAPRKAHNQTCSTNCGNAITTLTTWEGKPVSTIGGRFTDLHIQAVIDLIPVRTAFTPARASEIVTDLGSVTQDGEGAFTASGAYGELFKNIDMRVARGTGSLTKYNDALLGVTFVDKKIATANDQLTQYNNTFAITKILADTVIGQNAFGVASVADFTNGDSVKIMDNDGNVYSRTIISIVGTTITVNSGIPVILTIGALARIVKLK